ncbi:hypothetical protein JCM10908_000876 [Rhodotorula pacifica]|uniref:uncharacterized protein n=1 Tax=Rhodotorula pacifica TaxID=1495444 RepID=UPI00317C7F55
MSLNSTFSGGVPADAAWIAPHYEHLLEQVRCGQSPYLFLVELVHKLYHPVVPRGFCIQLYLHLGLLSVCALLIVLGLVIRLRQGRFWIFHRLDRTIVLPNASTLFGLCALIYAGLGFWLIASTHKVAAGGDLPIHYTGLRIAWFGAIWTGAFFEIWTTVAGWYVRKFGANYRESPLRSLVAVAIPVALILIGWIPPVLLCIPHAQKFNSSFRISKGITADLLEWQKTWHPRQGLDKANLVKLFAPGAQLGAELKSSHRFNQVCSWYCTVLLLLTFFCYVLAASLEVTQLGHTVSELRAQAAQREEEARALRSAHLSASLASKQAIASLPKCAYNQSTTTVSSQEAEKKHGDETVSTDRPAQTPWALLAWVRKNRIYSAVCIAIMLLTQTGVELWRAIAPLNLRYPSGQFQVEILISCWVHGVLATAVSLLLLFRSLDASSSRFLTRLRAVCPWMPFPPSVPSLMGTKIKSLTPSTSTDDQPPMYPQAAMTVSKGTVAPLMACPLASASSVVSAPEKHPYGSIAHLFRSDSLKNQNDVASEEGHTTDRSFSSSTGSSIKGTRGGESNNDHEPEEEAYLEAVEKARARWLPSRGAPEH